MRYVSGFLEPSCSNTPSSPSRQRPFWALKPPIHDASKSNRRETVFRSYTDKSSFFHPNRKREGFQRPGWLRGGNVHKGHRPLVDHDYPTLRRTFDPTSESDDLPLASLISRLNCADTECWQFQTARNLVHRPRYTENRASYVDFRPAVWAEGYRIAACLNPFGLRPHAPEFKHPRKLSPDGSLRAGLQTKLKEVEQARAVFDAMSLKSDQTSRCKSFLSLPAEIRNIIYRYACVKEDPIPIDTPLPSLTQTNQQLRQESLSMYHQENIFKFTIRNFERRRLESFFATFESTHSIRLNIWHKLDADARTLKANLSDWVEHSYRYEAPLLTYKYDLVNGDFDLEVHAHRLAVLFGLLRTCQNYEAGWGLSNEILTQAMVGLGVCGEREGDRW